MVNKWRYLKCNGLINDRGQQIRCLQLSEAAKQIGMSLKTLHDYEKQINLGKMYNFDFEKEQNSKMGVLR